MNTGKKGILIEKSITLLALAVLVFCCFCAAGEGEGNPGLPGDVNRDGIYTVSNDGYGQVGCVIFRPENLGSIAPGDSFDVEIKDHERMECLRYTVTFFSL